MKQLSIEQKAKAYDRVSKEVKDFFEGRQKMYSDVSQTLEYLFPELKESEDERIRKRIIALVNAHGQGMYKDEMLAWLEKQGNKTQGKSALEAIKEEKVDSQNCVKPAGKVESKFNVGDWVVASYGKVNQIVYVDKDGDGYTLDDDLYFSGSWCNMYHLWTIQDAKPGDVLAWDDSKCIAIFKNIYDEDSFNSYGFVGGCTGSFESRQSYHDIEGAHPATKEQRDQLEKAMADAGYIFDLEKKELKKIKQEPIEWSEEDKKMLEKVIANIECPPCTTANYKPIREMVDWLNFLKERYAWKPSDEQMDALKQAKTDACGKPYFKALASLYVNLRRY